MGIEVSIEEANFFLVKIELPLYQQIVVNENDLKSLLKWWRDHDNRFPNVALFAW
jgi:hypothetical protein